MYETTSVNYEKMLAKLKDQQTVPTVIPGGHFHMSYVRYIYIYVAPEQLAFFKKIVLQFPQKARAVKIYYFRTAGVFFYLYFHTAVHCFPCIVLKQTNYQRNLAKTSRLLFRFVLKNKLRCFLFNTMCNNQFMQICGKSQSLHHHIRRD